MEGWEFGERLRALLAGRKRLALERPQAVPAAVLLLCYPKAEEPHILLTVRTGHVEHHKGEVSFPGGARDPEDRSLEETALRESAEEVGLNPGAVEIVGLLDDLVTVSNFLVTPFVGIPKGLLAFHPFEREVAELIEAPLAALLRPQAYHAKPLYHQGRWLPPGAFEYNGHLIWGATARMLKEFLDLVAPELRRPRRPTKKGSPRADPVTKTGAGRNNLSF